MTDSQRHRQNGIGSRDCPRIGIDSTGAHHYLYEPNDRVLVARDGDVVDVQTLGGRSLDEYRAFVADQGREWTQWLRGQLAAEIAAIGAR